jgi:hypothetical protein
MHRITLTSINRSIQFNAIEHVPNGTLPFVGGSGDADGLRVWHTSHRCDDDGFANVLLRH